MVKKQTADKLCIYCGRPAEHVRKGEHIIPDAIGGARTITETSGLLVCHPCNNGELSRVDEQLCSRSYLAIIGSQELDAALWQMWDVDHAGGNQLIEARPRWVEGELQNLFHYQQIIFRPEGVLFFGDMEDARAFGSEDFENILVYAAHKAFQRFNCNARKKGLRFERIDRDLIERGYRYDPRVFARHTIGEIAKHIDSTEFKVRYLSNDDRRRALRQLEGMRSRPRTKGSTQIRGSFQPPMASTFDLGQTLRGLKKIGANILAAYCEKTPVNRETFNGVIRLIRGETHPSPLLIAGNGFVCAGDLDEMKAPEKSHAFRLTHLDNNWLLYASFFGGKISAHVSLAGPNNEDWKTLDVVAPLRSKDWQVTRSKIIRAIRVSVRWSEFEKVAPSIKLQNSYGNLTAEGVPISRLRARG